MFYIKYEANGLVDTCELNTADMTFAEELAARFVASYERFGGQIAFWQLMKKA